MEKLRQLLQRIDGKGYKAYKDIKGQYTFNTSGDETFIVNIDHVQGDPFAAPSRVSIRVDMKHANFPPELWQNTHFESTRRIALEDFIGRHTRQTIHRIIKGHRGSGNSGLINIDTSEQQILQRNAVVMKKDSVEARIVMGLPANGRRVAGQQAIDMFFNELPKIIQASLLYISVPEKQLIRHIESSEDQAALRQQLSEQQLVAFIANGSLLPRESGISDRPLQDSVVTFKSPASLEQEIALPNTGLVKGMGIPEGVTLIVGGGFHGKSTLLNALERGPYNHIPGDGREKIAALDSTVKVRAEDGRAIARVNISPFIDRLPFGRDTRQFSTENASGSTSQAANIIEAFECGTRLLLIDEDTSATNFMIRDERMQQLVAQDKEPITPLVYRIRELYEKHGVSSIIVMGGSGDYFDIADTVIMMDAYTPRDVTQNAKALARPLHSHVTDNLSTLPAFSRESSRVPGKRTLDASRKNRDVKIDSKELITLTYGEHRIDLSQVEQLVDIGQTRSIGWMIHHYANHHLKTSSSMVEGLQQLIADVKKNGLDIVSPYKVGNLALPRIFELAAAINRIRCDDWKT